MRRQKNVGNEWSHGMPDGKGKAKLYRLITKYDDTHEDESDVDFFFYGLTYFLFGGFGYIISYQSGFLFFLPWEIQSITLTYEFKCVDWVPIE